jgi:hypothetical protein
VIEGASTLNLVTEILRGWNNLAAVHGLRGDLEHALSGEAETTRLARHFGHHGFVRFIEYGPAIGNRYHAGGWDDSLARAEKVVAQLEQGVATYSAGTAYAYRGLIRIARDEAEGAGVDAERVVELAGQAGDPQALNPDLANAACIFTHLGNRQRADETLTEALENVRPLRRLGFGVMESHSLAWAALELGREGEVSELLERTRSRRPGSGPLSLSFKTDVKREESDEAARRATLSARAREARGKGNASATIESTLTPQNGGTKVDIVTDLQLAGPVAQYGRGLVQDVSSQLVGQFADCLKKQLGTSTSKEAEAAVPAQARLRWAGYASDSARFGGRSCAYSDAVSPRRTLRASARPSHSDLRLAKSQRQATGADTMRQTA